MKRRLIVSTIIVLVMSIFISKNVYALDSTYQGYDVAGRIEIPSINLDLPILDRATSNSMKVSVGLVYGTINQVGNTIIIGHNSSEYPFFSNIKNLNNGDLIRITDMTDTTITYVVYDKFETTTTDFEYATRDTAGKREISLTTNNDDISGRLIVLARESDENNTNNNIIVDNSIVVNNTTNETPFNITNNTNNTTNTSSNTANNVVVTNDIDNTVSKDTIPQTGENTLVIAIMVIISITGVISYTRFKKYRIVK